MYLTSILQWLMFTYLQSTDAAAVMAHNPVATNRANSQNTPLITSFDSGRPRTGRSANSLEAADDADHILDEEDDHDAEISDENSNSTEPGVHLGGWCITNCSTELVHTFCDPVKKVCTCEKKYPVRLGRKMGCAMPKFLGDQCFYSQTCTFSDSNAICAQIGHNAMCACKPGYHTVGIQKGVKKMFCSEDIVLLHTDLPSLLVVAAGIAVLSGLLCFVLKLFSSNRYGDGGHYANANLAPPLLFSSDNQWINGIPLTVHGRPSSRSSSQRSTANLTHYRSKGVLVPASRAGAARAAAILLIPCHLQNARTPDAAPSSHDDDLESPKDGCICFCCRSCAAPEAGRQDGMRHRSRRPSISSVHSNASSQMSSYSQRRYEQENIQREQRAAMRVAREDAARAVVPPTPSPMSTDHLLPSCEELNEIEDDPLGITSSALSVSSVASVDGNSLKTFQNPTDKSKS